MATGMSDSHNSSRSGCRYHVTLDAASAPSSSTAGRQGRTKSSSPTGPESMGRAKSILRKFVASLSSNDGLTKRDRWPIRRDCHCQRSYSHLFTGCPTNQSLETDRTHQKEAASSGPSAASLYHGRPTSASSGGSQSHLHPSNQSGSPPGSGQQRSGTREEEQTSSGPTDSASNFSYRLKHAAELRARRLDLGGIFQALRGKRGQVRHLRQQRDRAERVFMTAADSILPLHPHLWTLFQDLKDAQARHEAAENTLDQMVDDLQDTELDLHLEEQRTLASTESGHSSEGSGSVGSTCQILNGFDDRVSLKGISGGGLIEGILPGSPRRVQAPNVFCPDRDTADGRGLTKVPSRADYNPGTTAPFDGRVSEHAASALSVARIGGEPRNTRQSSPLSESPGSSITSMHGEDLQLEPADRDAGIERLKTSTLVFNDLSLLRSNPMHLLETPPQTARQSLEMALSLPTSFPPRRSFVEDTAREFHYETLLQGLTDKGDFINRWLLHKMCRSVLESQLMHSISQSCLDIGDVKRWQEDALYFWGRDGAANLPEAQFEDRE